MLWTVAAPSSLLATVLWLMHCQLTLYHTLCASFLVMTIMLTVNHSAACPEQCMSVCPVMVVINAAKWCQYGRHCDRICKLGFAGGHGVQVGDD